jgi:hypothetical protein
MLKKPNHKKITLYLDNNVLDLIKQVQDKINTQKANSEFYTSKISQPEVVNTFLKKTLTEWLQNN